MKMHSFKYLIKEGFSNVWANRLMSVASVGVLVACMVIIGLSMLITENVNQALGVLSEQEVVMVYMKDYNWALYGEKEDNGTENTASSQTENSTAETEKPDKNGILSTDYVIHNEEEANALCEKYNNSKAIVTGKKTKKDKIKPGKLYSLSKLQNVLGKKYKMPMDRSLQIVQKTFRCCTEQCTSE